MSAAYRVRRWGCFVFQPIEKVETDPDVPLRDVMDRIGHEMGEFAGAVHRIQSLVSLLVREDAFHEGKNVHEMQSLDLIAQKMECLSDFLGGLSRDVPAFWRVDTREAAQLMALVRAGGAADLHRQSRPIWPPSAPATSRRSDPICRFGGKRTTRISSNSVASE